MSILTLTEKQKEELENLVDTYKNALLSLQDFLSDLYLEWEKIIDEKPRDWLYTDAGEEATDKINTLENTLDELPGEFDLDVDELS